MSDDVVQKWHVKCHACNHEWDTKSKRDVITCTNCGIRTRKIKPAPTVPSQEPPAPAAATQAVVPVVGPAP